MYLINIIKDYKKMLTNAVFLLRSTMEGLVVTSGVSVRADGTDNATALETVFVIMCF